MKKLRHLFYPHESNNYRARLLHFDSLLAIIFALIIGSYFLIGVKNTFPSVLGISTGMTADQLVALTNAKRIENGLPPLTLNSELSQAAADKASDMFTQNYWAHISPDGKTPWIFIKNAGYDYTYAGENLARGYNDSSDVIDAWMASPEHRENMLSSNYKDVGFAIETGNLTGEDTVLVVEMFGSGGSQQAVATNNNQPAKIAQAAIVNQAPQEVQKQVSAPPNQGYKPTTRLVAAVKSKPLIDIQALSKNIAVLIVSVLMFILAIDIIVVERKKIIRFTGHNLDHIFFLALVLSVIFLLTKGLIV